MSLPAHFPRVVLPKPQMCFHMKLLHTLTKAGLAAALLSVAHAAQIIWVVQEDGPGGQEFVDMLQTEGHDVEIMVVAGAPPDADQQATMNAADLVIVSRKVNSGDGAYNTFVWNDNITTPLISHSPYILRTNDTERWQWMDGNGLADAVPSTVEANAPSHKIFEGIPLEDGISAPWHFARDRNTSVSTDGIAGGGMAIATKTGDPAGAIIAAEWEANQVAVGPRMMFMMGSREAAENEGIGIDYGKFNLTPIGQIAFLNSVSHYLGPWADLQLWAPFSLALGEVDSAPGAQESTLLVKNLGLAGPVSISGTSFEGAGAGFYTVVSAPDSVGPGEVAEIVISLDTQGNTGSFDAELVISSDSTVPDHQNRRVAITAKAFNFGGPTAHYRLNETEGTDIADVTGFDNHAVIEGDADLSQASLIGDAETGVRFAGGQLNANFEQVGALTNFSVGMWIQPDSVDAPLQTLFGKGTGTPIFGLFLAANNIQWWNEDSPSFETTDGPISADAPTHVVAVYETTSEDGTPINALKLYANGAEIAATEGLPEFTDDGLEPFSFGAFNGAFGFTGAMDDIQIYSKAITANEVAFLFENPGAVLSGGAADGPTDVTSPEDAILLVNGENDDDANAGEPPAAEGVENAINNLTQKYLNFLDLGSGFIVTPAIGPTKITGARFYPANDSPERDPASFEIWGSTEGPDGPFTMIASGDLTLPDQRNAGGQIPIDGTHVFQEVTFENTAVYVSYQVVFPTVRDAVAANSMQIAEVELLGSEGILPPEPGGGSANIVWVDWVESDAGQEFKDLLIGDGHTVTNVIGVGDPTGADLDALNAADLVIVSRKVSSGDYNQAVWDEITAPLMLMSGYLSRANRWGWFDADGLEDVTPASITANAADHPIFEGLTLTDGTTGPWHVAVDRGTSAPTTDITVGNGGTLLASGDGGNIIAAEWPEGTVAAGKRILFLAGSREADGNGIETAGQFDLTADGVTAFVNAARYLAGVQDAFSADGLLGYWPLDEGSGAVAGDASGTGADGTIIAPDAAWVSDPTRGTVYQSGGGSYIDLGTLPVIGLEDDFTWSFWVNANETSNNNIVLGNRYMPDGNDFDPREFVKFTPTTFEWHFNAAGENSPGDNTALVVGEWQHNLVTKAGTTLTYYRNGEVIATSEITGAPVNGLPLYLGGQPDTGGAAVENFSGLFDEVAIFGRALSAADVTQVYALGLAGEPLTSDGGGGNPGGGGDGTSEITGVSTTASGIALSLPEGTTYDIEFSADLVTWSVIASDVTGSYEDTDAGRTGTAGGFYRGVVK